MIKHKPCIHTLVLKFGSIIYRWHLRESRTYHGISRFLWVEAIARENEMAKRCAV